MTDNSEHLCTVSVLLEEQGEAAQCARLVPTPAPVQEEVKAQRFSRAPLLVLSSCDSVATYQVTEGDRRKGKRNNSRSEESRHTSRLRSIIQQKVDPFFW